MATQHTEELVQSQDKQALFCDSSKVPPPFRFIQWHNMQGGQGAECPPETSDWEIFVVVRQKRQGKKGKRVKLRRKEGKLWKGRWKIWNRSRKSYKRGGDLFFFFFLLFTFENNRNLFWVYQNGNFLPGKNISCWGKNQEKWLCPLRKICLLRPWIHLVHTSNSLSEPASQQCICPLLFWKHLLKPRGVHSPHDWLRTPVHKKRRKG